MLYGIFIILLLLSLTVLLWPLLKTMPPTASPAPDGLGSATPPQGESKLFIAAICLFFFGGGFILYQFVGTPQIVPLLEQREQKLAELKAEIVQHSEAVKTNPNNLSAWVALGGDFMETGQYGAAANAFRQSVKLSGGAPDLILAYARAMILDADGKVGDHAKKSLEMVLLQDKDNAEARYFLAVRKLQDGNNQAAMRDMKSLYHDLPEDSSLKAMIDRQIGR